MNTLIKPTLSITLLVLLAGSLLLSACAPAPLQTQPPQPAATSVPASTSTSDPLPTATPAATAVPSTTGTLQYTLDSTGMAQSIQVETVAAVSGSDDHPYWEILPAYTRLTLQGYPVSSNVLQPQIFIYPTKDLAATNEGAGKILASLQELIQSPKEIANMPFLPLFNASQMMHVQVQYVDFKNGHGVRYLTQFAQGFTPINNNELIYTYQGLTSDGKYYIAVVLPVNHPSLPADGKVTGKEPPEFTGDFPKYLANVVSALNPQAANTFTPDLTRLDAMMSSLEIH